MIYTEDGVLVSIMANRSLGRIQKEVNILFTDLLFRGLPMLEAQALRCEILKTVNAAVDKAVGD